MQQTLTTNLQTLIAEGKGLMVNVIPFYFVNLSSNPAWVYSFYSEKTVWKARKINQKETHIKQRSRFYVLCSKLLRFYGKQKKHLKRVWLLRKTVNATLLYRTLLSCQK